MTPAPARSHRRIQARSHAPQAPRRVSGPVARRLVPAPAGPAGLPRRGTTGFFARVRALPEHRLIDRLLRSRLWICMLGIALLGIVTMQVSLLKLNSGISRAVETTTTLERQNAALEESITKLTSTDRVQIGAEALNMLMPAAGDVSYLRAGQGDVDRAVSRMQPPSDEAAALLANGGIAPGSMDRPGGGGRAGHHHDPDDHHHHAGRPRGDGRAGHRHDPHADGHTTRACDDDRPGGRRRGRRTGLAVGLVERRIGLLFAVFLGMILLAGARAGWLGVVKADSLKSAAATQQKSDIVVPAPRGTITDVNGTELAVSQPAQTIAATPYLIDDPAAAAAKLAKVLRRPQPGLLKKLARRDTGFVYIARGVPARRAQRAERLGIEGLQFIPEYIRDYPRDWMASQLLGDVGTEGHGLSGLEYKFDAELRGQDGERRLVRDALGDTIELREVQRTVPGEPLRLTLDANIQDHTEDVLDEVGEQWQPKGATAVVMDPRDGAILALANWPRVNANRLHEAPDYAMTNRATGATYEPGSTFKAFTVAGALEDGKVKPSTSFSLPPVLQVADREITDSHPRGWEQRDVAGILQVSSNVGAALIGRTLGARRFDEWVRRFGFGTPTGVDLPGEESGIVLDYADYSGSTAGNMAMGQGLAVTPLQMAAGYSGDRQRGDPPPAPHRRRGRRPRAAGAGGPPRDLGEDVVADAQHARGRPGPRRHGDRRRDRRLRARRQDRHGGEAGRERRLLEGQVRGVVRRVRPRGQAAAARRGHGRRAQGRHLRRHRRRAGVQGHHLVRADEPADRARLARIRRQSREISVRPIARNVSDTASAAHGWVTSSTITSPTQRSSVRLAVAVVTGSGERFTATRRPALTPWLASAVVLEPTAARASSTPVASPLSRTPSAAAIVGRITVWTESQTWST